MALRRAELDSLRAIPDLARLVAHCAIPGPNIAFTAACGRGRLRLAQWLVAIFRLGAEAVRRGECYALRRVCEGGHFATLRWLMRRFALTAEDFTSHDYEATQLLMDRGLAVRHWLVVAVICNGTPLQRILRHLLLAPRPNRVGDIAWALCVGVRTSPPEHQGSIIYLNFVRACRFGYIGMAQKMATRSDLKAYLAANPAKTFEYILELNDSPWSLTMLRWVVRLLRSTECEIRRDVLARTVLILCEDGNAAAVHWMTGAFALTPTELDPARCYFAACRGGHLGLSELLAAKYKLGDVSKKTGMAWAARYGHENIVQRRLAASYFRATDCGSAIANANQGGHNGLVRWVVARGPPHCRPRWRRDILTARAEFGDMPGVRGLVLDGENTDADGLTTAEAVAHIIVPACREGGLAVARWCADHYRLRRDAVRHSVGMTYVGGELPAEAFERGHMHVVRWLIARFAFTSAQLAPLGPP